MSHTRQELEQEANYWRARIRDTRDSAGEHEMYLMLEALMLIEFRLAQMVTGGNDPA